MAPPSLVVAPPLVSLLMKVGMVSIMDLTIQQVAVMTIAILNLRKVVSFQLTASNPNRPIFSKPLHHHRFQEA